MNQLALIALQHDVGALGRLLAKVHAEIEATADARGAIESRVVEDRTILVLGCRDCTQGC